MKAEKRFIKEPIKGKNGVYRVIDKSPPNGDALNLSDDAYERLSQNSNFGLFSI